MGSSSMWLSCFGYIVLINTHEERIEVRDFILELNTILNCTYATAATE